MEVAVKIKGSAIKLAVIGTLLGTLTLSAPVSVSRPAFGQGKQPTTLPSDDLSEVLNRRGNVTLRDTSITDAMFVLRKQWDVDMVVSTTIDGSVNASFSNAALREILDALLLSRGFGYRVVGRSIVILPLDQIGALKPLFDSEVIALRSANPNEMKEAVELMLSPHGKVMAMPSTRSLLVLDYPDRIKHVKQRVAVLDQIQSPAPPAAGTRSMEAAQGSTSRSAEPTTPDLEVRVFRPQYVKIATLQPAIDNLISADGRVAIINNEDQIMVADRPEVMNVIEEAVLELDQPRPQVRIWALIYDCSLEDVERLGVNWSSGIFGNTRNADGTPRDQLLLNAITAASPPAGAANGALTAMSIGRNVSLNAVVNALQTAKDSKLLADPNVTVMNHEPAMIQIVTEVPYQQLTQGIQGGSIGTTAFREAGVTLSVTPHIARDNTISMMVNPRFSVLTGFTETDEQPIIDRREAKTTVRVTNGETFVLGGLRQKTKIIDRSGIPGLQDIKTLKIGKLFQYKSETFRESELLVFITPEVVPATATPRPREDAARRFGYEELDLNQPAPKSCLPYLEVDYEHTGGPNKGLRVIETTPLEDISTPIPRAPYESNPNTSATVPPAELPAQARISEQSANRKDPPQKLVERLKGTIKAGPSGGTGGGTGRARSSGSSGGSSGGAGGFGLPFNLSLPGFPGAGSAGNVPDGIQPMKGEAQSTKPGTKSRPSATPIPTTDESAGRTQLRSKPIFSEEPFPTSSPNSDIGKASTRPRVTAVSKVSSQR